MKIKTWNTGDIYFAETTITAPVNFTSRFVGNFTQGIVTLKSTPYISTTDKNVNAKSVLGLLSADIRKGNILKIQTMNSHSCEQSKLDLEIVTKLIKNESY